MRTCEANDTCVNTVWGTDKNTGIGYCHSHQYLRTDLKKPKSKSFGLSKRSPRKHTHSLGFGFESQPDLFAWLWEEASAGHKHVTCKYTSENITKFLYPAHPELWLNCFAHILPKKNYPYFRLNPANIRVVYPEFHTIIDQGTSEDRKKHPSWKFDLWDAEVLQMKEEYKVFKKQNLLA